MLKSLFLVFFALIAVATCSWEGVYNFNGSYSVTVCQNDTKIYGRIGDYGIFFATVTASNTSIAYGKYFYMGDLYTGNRVSYRRFTGGRGRIGLLFNSNRSDLYAAALPRDSTGSSVNGTVLFFLPRNSTDVGDDRVYDCAIIDTTATETVAGHWNTTAKSQVDANICLTNNTQGRADARLYGSYKFHYNFDYADEILPGYFLGYCAANAQVCGTIFYQNDLHYTSYTSFGAELIYRLSDDRLVIQHTRGAPGIDGFGTYNTGYNPLVRKGTASKSDCTKYEDSYFLPTQCRSMSNKLCNALSQYGFCQVADKQGACVRTKFTL